MRSWGSGSRCRLKQSTTSIRESSRGFGSGHLCRGRRSCWSFTRWGRSSWRYCWGCRTSRSGCCCITLAIVHNFHHSFSPLRGAGQTIDTPVGVIGILRGRSANAHHYRQTGRRCLNVGNRNRWTRSRGHQRSGAGPKIPWRRENTGITNTTKTIDPIIFVFTSWISQMLSRIGCQRSRIGRLTIPLRRFVTVCRSVNPATSIEHLPIWRTDVRNEGGFRYVRPQKRKYRHYY